jgi:hypothetical protein
MGSGVNEFVQAGWNYWSYVYWDRTNGGGDWSAGWATQANGYFCYFSLGPGYTSSGSYTPDDLGCGGYIHGEAHYEGLSSSYVYIEMG